MNSHKTAITRKSPSSPMKYLKSRDLIVGRMLDYGCGKGFDADFYNMSKYDPYFFPDRPIGLFDAVVCNYVLNVVYKDAEAEILNDIRSYLNYGGTAYIAVRRDIKKEGITSRNTYQRDVILDYPSLVHYKNRFEIYYMRNLE